MANAGMIMLLVHQWHFLNNSRRACRGDMSLGAGANVLFGSSNRTIALQPQSVEGQAGVNVALRAFGLTLAFIP